MRWPRLTMALASVALLSLGAGFEAAQYAAAPAKWRPLAAIRTQLFSLLPVHASSRDISHTPFADPDDVSRLIPQLQAERLLERAITGSEPSLEQIVPLADGWRGQIQETTTLFQLVRKGLASDDLRVRSAAAEIDLAANGLAKTSQSVAHLSQQLRHDPEDRTWNLWRLGVLGNRGVEQGTVLATLVRYARDPQETTRFWAVEGLAALGTNASLNPLLDALRADPSPKVRRGAALNLAQSGMLTLQQRLTVIPDLLNFLDDDSLDMNTRGLVYATLRGITGEALGNDVGAWRKWWATHDSPRKHAPNPKLLHA